MSRAKPKGIALDTRRAWQEWVRSLSPDECGAWDAHASHLLDPSSSTTPRNIPMDEDRLRRAEQSLDSIDVVATADRPDLLLQLLASRFGWPTQTASTVAALDGRPPVDDQLAELEDEIRRENALDQQLYECARQLMLDRVSAADTAS